MVRLCNFQANGKNRLGIVIKDLVADLNLAYALAKNTDTPEPWPSMIDFLAGGFDNAKAAMEAEKYIIQKLDAGSTQFERALFTLDEIKLCAPIPNPPKFLCIAGNYKAHIEEADKVDDAELPQDIHVFTKNGGKVIIGHGDPIIVSTDVQQLDHELEIAIVIGKEGRYIPLEKAVDHIGGYTIVNDVSDRKYLPTESSPIHWFAMKSQDNFAPMGPFLLLAHGLSHPVDLEMKLWVNGEQRQHARTTDMIFGPEWIVSRLSQLVTLEIGDVISTGTPAGVGLGTGVYLNDNDIVELEIENIGRLENQVIFKDPVDLQTY